MFQQVEGVLSVESGYAGGARPNPTYEQVCTGVSGHAEVIRLEFDPERISFENILRIFFGTHDPTTLNRQGNDVGTQYRSVIFTHSPEQEETARRLIAEIDAGGYFRSPVVTEVSPAPAYYPAEDYHQNYYRQHPGQGYCSFVIAPKMEKFRKVFVAHLKKG
ncbi:MAG: peptide-methionine (S)-S-oxide reductase MsrA [Candidatus Protistobacter heckmanni]|nr:peptide-methionine (S)-S-oxide reductase MsrA [Candidatus Protistobacter heckmanni]